MPYSTDKHPPKQCRYYEVDHDGSRIFCMLNKHDGDRHRVSFVNY